MQEVREDDKIMQRDRKDREEREGHTVTSFS